MYSVSAVSSRDAGGNALLGFNRDGEGGLEGGGVVANHRAQSQLITLFRGQRQTDQTATIFGHEVDEFRRGRLGRQCQITLVLTVFVVYQDDHLSLADILNCLFNSCYGHTITFRPIKIHSLRAFSY